MASISGSRVGRRLAGKPFEELTAFQNSMNDSRLSSRFLLAAKKCRQSAKASPSMSLFKCGGPSRLASLSLINRLKALKAEAR